MEYLVSKVMYQKSKIKQKFPIDHHTISVKRHIKLKYMCVIVEVDKTLNSELIPQVWKNKFDVIVQLNLRQTSCDDSLLLIQLENMK